MDLEGLKKRVNDFKDDWERSRQRCEIEDFSDDVISLISIIEQAEKSLEKISKNAYLDHLGDVSLLMLQMSGNIADEALKAIRGN